MRQIESLINEARSAGCKSTAEGYLKKAINLCEFYRTGSNSNDMDELIDDIKKLTWQMDLELQNYCATINEFENIMQSKVY